MTNVEPVPASLNPFKRFENMSPHLAKVAFAWGLGQSGLGLYKKVRTKVRERMTFTIKIAGTDEIFPDLHEWMLSLLPENQRRALMASTGEYRPHSELAESGSSGRPPEPHVRLRYDSSRRQTVHLDGHKVIVEVQRDETKHWDKIPENWQALMQTMVFTSQSPAGRDAVLAHIENLLEVKRTKPGPPPFRMSSRWGNHWVTRSDLPPRDLKSIILKKGQLEGLVDDLGEFLASEADYGRRCLPWHRGYLFFGAPGTGKTSVAKALAHHFGLPLYYLPLGQLKEDAELISLISDVNPRSLLVLEDVDVFHAMTQRNDEQGGVTLSTVLNGLDGIWTPHGMVSILTTNDRSVLDPALLRAGRVDREEEFADLDTDQARRLIRWFYGRSVNVVLDTTEVVGRSPAQLIGAMARHKDDPDAAVLEFTRGAHE